MERGVCRGALLLLTAGCVSVTERQPGALLPEESTSAVVSEPRLKMTVSDVDYTAPAPLVRVSVSGQAVRTWQTRQVHEARAMETRRSSDPVEFPVFTDDEFSLCESVGWFAWSGALFSQKDEPFALTAAAGFFPWTTSIVEKDKHFVDFDGAWSVSTDGALESPVLPFTLSGEWLGSIVNTTGFVAASTLTAGIGLVVLTGQALSGEDDAQEAWLGPITLVGAPVADAVVLAADTAITGGAVTLDVIKGVGVIAADAVVMAGAAALDLTWKGVTLGADLVRAAGDALWPERLETRPITCEPPFFSDWRTHESTVPVELQAFSVVATAGGRTKRVPLDAQGTATLDVTAFEGAVAGQYFPLTLTLVRQIDGWVAVEKQEKVVDQPRLRECIVPDAKRPGY